MTVPSGLVFRSYIKALGTSAYVGVSCSPLNGHMGASKSPKGTEPNPGLILGTAGPIVTVWKPYENSVSLDTNFLQKGSWVPNRAWDPRYVSQHLIFAIKICKGHMKTSSKCNLASSFPLWTSGGLKIPLTGQNSGLWNFLKKYSIFCHETSS